MYLLERISDQNRILVRKRFVKNASRFGIFNEIKSLECAGVIDSPRALEHFTHSENQLHVLTKIVSKDMIRISHGNHRKKSLLVMDQF